MAIIDDSYFNAGFLYIPNNNSLNVGESPNVQNDLQLFIDVFERELLINALGITLYEELEAELPNPTSQKWIDLLDGKTYSINGEDKRWDGLKGNNKQSLIAFYVFCQYIRNDSSIYSTSGTVLTKSVNSVNVDPTPKYISSHNKFIERYQGHREDNHGVNLGNIVINRSGMVGIDYYGSQNNSFVDMYQYLTDQNTLETDPQPFPDFKFKLYYRENSWGL